MDYQGSAYEIVAGSAERIHLRSAKRIRSGSAKRIAGYWAEYGAANAAAMTAKRTDMHRLQELVRLHRLGTGAREVARLLGLGPNTERRYREALESAGLLQGEVEAVPELELLKAAVLKHAPPAIPPQQTSSVESHRDRIEALQSKGLRPKAIYDRLRVEDATFSASLGAVKRLMARLARERGPREQDVAIPMVTEAGEIAQVDLRALRPRERLPHAQHRPVTLGRTEQNQPRRASHLSRQGQVREHRRTFGTAPFTQRQVAPPVPAGPREVVPDQAGGGNCSSASVTPSRDRRNQP